MFSSQSHSGKNKWGSLISESQPKNRSNSALFANVRRHEQFASLETGSRTALPQQKLAHLSKRHLMLMRPKVVYFCSKGELGPLILLWWKLWSGLQRGFNTWIITAQGLWLFTFLPSSDHHKAECCAHGTAALIQCGSRSAGVRQNTSANYTLCVTPCKKSRTAIACSKHASVGLLPFTGTINPVTKRYQLLPGEPQHSL